MPTFAATERTRLCESARAAGPDAPTLCGEWTVTDLLEHLVVREGSPAAVGIVLKPLEPLTEAAMRRAGRAGFEALVERVEHPPAWSPVRIGAVDKALNTLEMFVHHEDIRRAAPDWQPRALDEREQRTLWRAIGTPGKGLVRPAGVPVSICWPVAGAERVQVLRGGADPVVVSGEPSELVMFLFGRAQHRDLRFDGPPASVDRLRAADLGA